MDLNRFSLPLPGVAALLLLAGLGASGCDADGPAAADPGPPAVAAAPSAPPRSLALGGRGFEAIRDMDVAPDGDVFIAGSTDSPDFPTTEGAPDRSLGRGERSHDAFVVRLSPTGELRWSRYLGGPEYDRAYALELAPDGTVVVAGRAGAGFPVTEGAAQTTFRGGVASDLYGEQDGFVCRLEPERGEVRFCTYFGGTDPGILRDVDVTPQNEIVVAGGRDAAPLPPEWTTHRGPREVAGSTDGVVGKLSADGSRVLWTRHVGGSANDGGTPSVRAAADGSVVTLMFTGSSDLPATPGAFDGSYAGEGDLFVTSIEPDGSAIRWLTYLGGREVEFTETHGLALAPDGTVVVAAVTRSDDFPTTEGALQRRYGGHGGRNTGARSNYSGDGFVARLSADGSRLLAATFLGGSLGDGIEGVDVTADAIAVSGATFSDDMPGAPGGRGGADFFVLRLAPGLDRLEAGGRFGAKGRDWGRATAIAPDGTVWAGGVSWAPVAPADGGHPGRPPGEAEAVVLELR